MCYATKRRIADCVKDLMRHEQIDRITIQDVMEEMNMSRQSFYYHFKDIYDVLEWIARNDFEKKIMQEGYDSMEEWICLLLDMIRENKSFFEKVVNEIEWPRILCCVKAPVEEKVSQIFNQCNQYSIRKHQEEWNFCVEFFTTSFCYYLMDYIYRKRNMEDSVVLSELQYLISVLDGSELMGQGSYTCHSKVVAI